VKIQNLDAGMVDSESTATTAGVEAGREIVDIGIDGGDEFIGKSIAHGFDVLNGVVYGIWFDSSIHI
jgi:hypothetical protein